MQRGTETAGSPVGLSSANQHTGRRCGLDPRVPSSSSSQGTPSVSQNGQTGVQREKRASVVSTIVLIIIQRSGHSERTAFLRGFKYSTAEAPRTGSVTAGSVSTVTVV